MYKVFFVDDEAAMRAGIRNNVNWDNSEFTLAGEAPDGEMALSLMQEITPDILITDVKMPFMDGLELARRTKKTMPWIKIIILSGHDEFEYAKQAITIGVEDYLLKPITSAMIIETLNNIAVRIEEENEKRRNVEKLCISGLLPFAEKNKVPIIDKLRYASKADIPGFLEDCLNNSDNSIASFMYLNYIIIDILMASSKIIEELGGEARVILSEFSNVSGILNDNTSFESAKKILTSVLEKAIDFRNTMTGSKYHDVIAKAREYIRKYYFKQGISLHSVAKEVNISPNHFSTIFSQETGETFINYITNVRLEQAKILLKTTNMRTSDIGYEVGYNDTHYFSYVFKKNTGMTPKEFRKTAG